MKSWDTGTDLIEESESFLDAEAIRRLKSLIAQRPPSVLIARRFFAARNGVLTLVYSGFSKPVLDVKAGLPDILGGLCPEDDGSKWPKTSLAAVCDERRLTIPDVDKVLRICRAASFALDDHPVTVPVDALHLVKYACRSLERESSGMDLPFGSVVPVQAVPVWHREHIDGVLRQAEPSASPAYKCGVAETGNRASHYRSPASGWSLVIGSGVGSALAVREFRQTIEAQLPDMFTWFAPESLHVTVRSLNASD